MQLPDKVNRIIGMLYKAGYEAFAVGGCVRDMLLGKEPHDFDITTNASPLQVKELFRKTIDTGIEHGTVTVMLDGEGFEVTTYRVDGEYEDNRHPKEVIFTTNLELDLQRRDFTINAMAYNDVVGLVDIFGGQEDLDKGVIRCVGNAVERFNEDALRILRGVRFCAQLNFEIEDKTMQAMRTLAHNLKNISAERIKTELDKILLSDNCDRFVLMSELGINKVIFPEFDTMLDTQQNNPNHIYDVGTHTIVATSIIDREYDNELVKKLESLIDMSLLEDDKTRLMLKWTMLLHDAGKPKMKTIDENGIAHYKMHQLESVKIAQNVFERLKFDNYTANTAKKLIEWHDYRFNPTPKSVRKAVSKLGDEYVDLLFLVQRADILGQNPDTFDEKLSKLIEAYECYMDIKEQNACLSIKELKVNGNDLIRAGIKPGPAMGKIMNGLLERVLENPELNNKEDLLLIAKEIENNI